MPTTYDYRPNIGTVTVLRCGTCDATASFEGSRRSALSGGEVNLASGRDVAETFRFIGGRGRYTTSCRACERTARERSGRSERTSNASPRASRARRSNAARQFGVELELRFPTRVDRDAILQALRAAGLAVGSGYDSGVWKVKSDGSIRGHGWEVVSPPLSGDDGMRQLEIATRVLRELGGKADTSTGLHVHHDVADMNATQIKRFYRGWFNSQRITDGLVSPSRRGVAGPTYCRPLTASDCAAVEAARDLRHVGGVTRYKTVNITSYARYGTIEIRQHQGTCDFEKIRTWVLLGQALLDDAKSASEPRPAASSVSELLDRLGNLIDATAKTFSLGRAVEFGYAPVSQAVAA